MKTPALFTALFLSIATAGVASTINFDTGGGGGHMFVTSSGDRLSSGSLVRLGTLGTEGDLSTFAEFGRTTISHPGAVESLQVGGFLTNPVSNGDTAANEAAAGKKVYLWVYATPEESAQSGVFTSSDASWTVPQTFTGAADQTHNLFLANDGVTAETAPGGLPGAAWNRGAITLTAPNGQEITNETGAVYTVPVPEPSAMLLTGLAALAGLSRRRRN